MRCLKITVTKFHRLLKRTSLKFQESSNLSKVAVLKKFLKATALTSSITRFSKTKSSANHLLLSKRSTLSKKIAYQIYPLSKWLKTGFRNFKSFRMPGLIRLWNNPHAINRNYRTSLLNMSLSWTTQMKPKLSASLLKSMSLKT